MSQAAVERKSRTRTARPKPVGSESPPAENSVSLVGRVSAPPEERVLPSGDVLVTFRLVVARPAAARGPRTTTVDTLDCTVWKTGLQQRVLRWQGSEMVAVSGALRRRFWRGAGGAASRTEVEVERVTLVRSAPTPRNGPCEDG